MTGKSFPRVYTPSDTLQYEKALQVLTKVQLPPKFKVLEAPLSIHITFALVRPKSSQRAYPSVKPDLDNYVKCLDALNGLVWKDDAQIVEIHALKVYAETPGLMIVINPK